MIRPELDRILALTDAPVPGIEQCAALSKRNGAKGYAYGLGRVIKAECDRAEQDREKIRRAVQTHGSARAAAAALGITRWRVARAMKQR